MGSFSDLSKRNIICFFRDGFAHHVRAYMPAAQIFFNQVVFQVLANTIACAAPSGRR
jgi:hypothetical protein